SSDRTVGVRYVDLGLLVAREADLVHPGVGEYDGQLAVRARLSPRSHTPTPDSSGPQISPSSATASRSSRSSLTLASMRSREQSLRARPGTILHTPFSVVHGNPEIKPSETPYEPSEHTAMLT